jgi:hypothetical protein
MTGKSFTFDLGRIMDEAFAWAQEFGERFQEGLQFPEELREKLRERFKSYEDLYPHYPYPRPTST